MSDAFEVEEGLTFGEWLHRELQEAAHFEQEPWAIERLRTVEQRLQGGRRPERRLVLEVPWLDAVTGFTAPGRYVYISRALFERCQDEEQLAFIAAHEIAHHDLGHLDVFRGWAARLRGVAGGELLAAGFHALAARIHGPEKECDADRHGLDLCLAAGYDGRKCLALLDVLEMSALDMGDIDIVFGPGDSDDELAPDAPWATKAQVWLWQRTRGYLPLRDRRQMLLAHLKSR